MIKVTILSVTLIMFAFHIIIQPLERFLIITNCHQQSWRAFLNLILNDCSRILFTIHKNYLICNPPFKNIIYFSQITFVLSGYVINKGKKLKLGEKIAVEQYRKEVRISIK